MEVNACISVASESEEEECSKLKLVPREGKEACSGSRQGKLLS